LSFRAEVSIFWYQNTHSSAGAKILIVQSLLMKEFFSTEAKVAFFWFRSHHYMYMKQKSLQYLLMQESSSYSMMQESSSYEARDLIL
jgi:hypothetical protein